MSLVVCSSLTGSVLYAKLVRCVVPRKSFEVLSRAPDQNSGRESISKGQCTRSGKCMRTHYRCTDKRNCGARKTLPQPIEWYVPRPMCPECGKDKLKHDPSVNAINRRVGVCICDGLSYPHRKGAEPWCEHSKREPTDEEYRERYYYT